MKPFLTALMCIVLSSASAQMLSRVGLSTGSKRTIWSEGHVEYRYGRINHVAASFYTNLQNTMMGVQVGSKLGEHVNAGIGLGLSDGKIGPLLEAEYCFDKNYQRKYIPYVGGALTQKFAFLRAGIQFKWKKKVKINIS